MSKTRIKESKPPRVKIPRPKRHHMNVMVVPHGAGPSRNVYVHFFVLALLILASVGLLTFAGIMVSGYWKNIIDLSQLTLLEQRDRDEQRKLEVMEKGISELEGKAADINKQYDTIVISHRLGEVRPAEALLPPEDNVPSDRLLAVETRLSRVSKNLAVVRRRFDADPDGLALIPSIIPCSGWFYREFGNTVSPFTSRVEMHRGLDIVAPRGTAIVATADGIVTKADLEEHYGLVVEIDHGNGYVTRYGHNMRNVAQSGMKIKRGQIIAYVGSTGRSSCTHVHYEVIKDGLPYNPRFFILREPKLKTVATAPRGNNT
jgi:murein DD-endopeptidase MepM/ murein hydrolase activator NlpD